MPGAFHTELVLEADQVKVYLLDVNLKNPVTADSAVALELLIGVERTGVECLSTETYFACPLPKRKRSPESIVVHARRKTLKGKPARYTLPLTFKKK